MAWSTADTYTSGLVLTAASLNKIGEDVNIIGAAWSNFTPTLSGGWALGNSTYTAKYIQYGRNVAFYAVITIGSTATKGTTLTAALPVTAADSGAYIGVQASATDTGTAFFPMTIAPSGSPTTTVEIGAMTAGGTYVGFSGVTSTVPFTWATSDIIAYGGFYEAATA